MSKLLSVLIASLFAAVTMTAVAGDAKPAADAAVAVEKKEDAAKK